jgi:Tol biopolymer transport system component
MLTGRTLFAGDTVTDVIASVVKEEPDLDALPAETPGAVRKLLGRCLRKDPRTRLPDIGAARLDLQEVRAGTIDEAGGPTGDAEDRARERRRSRTRGWAWAAVALALAGIAAVLMVQRMTATVEPRPAAHFLLDTPEDLAFWVWDPVVVSPDGRSLAFVGTSPSGERQLWLRPLDSPEARALPGTVGAFGGHFWSADSASIAFAAEGELRKVVLATGTVQRVCALPRSGGGAGDAFNGGTWSAEGTVVFDYGFPASRLYSVPGAGGEARLLTSPDESRGETAHWWPQFLPDGRHLLLTVSASEEEHTGLHVISLESPGERRRIRPERARFQYAPPGYLLFVQDDVLLGQRFDPRELVTRGEAVPIASSVAVFPQVPDWGWFSASTTGRMAWLSGEGSEARLEWIDREGRRLGTLGEPGRYGQIVLSPDDKRVAAEVPDADGRYDLWVIDVARGVPSRLTTDPASERDPVWSPDSQELIFSSDASGDQNLLRKGLQGSEPAAALPGGIGQTAGERDIAKDWFREGNTLLYLTIGAERALWALSLDGGGPPESLVKGFAIDKPHVSPDGRWLAYISTESGRYEVYVEPFRRRGERVRVSADGGAQPRWRGDGKELFYLSLDGALMAVDVRSGATGPEVGMPTTLVPARDLGALVEGPDYNDYGVSADGQRFLVKRPVDEGERQRIHVLLDWPSLLE